MSTLGRDTEAERKKRLRQFLPDRRGRHDFAVTLAESRSDEEAVDVTIRRIVAS